jgi:hypothetical protein
MITTLDKIKTHLLFYGITEHVEIEKEAEEDILCALEINGVEDVRIEEGALIIEYNNE